MSASLREAFGPNNPDIYINLQTAPATIEAEPSEQNMALSQNLGGYIIGQFVKRGFAYVPLDYVNEEAKGLLSSLDKETRRFFDERDEDELERFIHPDRTVGYRESGKVNAGDSNNPDRNKTVMYRPSIEQDIPFADEIRNFVSAQRNYYHKVGTVIMDAVLQEFGRLYNYPHPLSYHDSSMLQLNWFDDNTVKLGTEQQGEHEDRTYITVSWMSDDGFAGDVKFGALSRPMYMCTDEESVIVMPAGVLTAMTNGAIPPFMHRVVKLGGATPERTRSSYVIFYSLNRPQHGSTVPYTGNQNVDDAVLSASGFGEGAFVQTEQ